MIRYPTLWIILWVLGVLFTFLGIFGLLGRYIHIHSDDKDERMEEGVFYTFISIGILGWTFMLISGSVQFSETRKEAAVTQRKTEIAAAAGDKTEIAGGEREAEQNLIDLSDG